MFSALDFTHSLVENDVILLRVQMDKGHRMTTIVEGQYKQGKIELNDVPVGLSEGPVRLILIARDQAKPPCLLTFGKYRTGVMSSLEDFEDGQWRGEAELDDRNGE
jgi:hypothetical protein